MSSASDRHGCDHTELVSVYALHALPSSEVPVVEAHISACSDCRQELETLRPIIDSFVSWPTDVLRPSASLWERLAQRIAAETGGEPVLPAPPRWAEPEWEEVAPGISCKLLATDTEKDRVSMLVRLAPGVDYPPHRHAGRRRAASAPRRAVDRRQEALSRRLQPGGGRQRRSTRLERDRLHVRSDHLDSRRPSLISVRSLSARRPLAVHGA